MFSVAEVAESVGPFRAIVEFLLVQAFVIQTECLFPLVIGQILAHATH